EDLLLPQWVHRQRGGNDIREVLGRGARESFGIVLEDQRVAGFKELHEFALDARIGGGFPVLQVIHVPFKKRVFREKFHHAKRGAAGREDIHTAVFVAFYHVENFGGAAYARDAFG